jgi:hypothetical protein
VFSPSRADEAWKLDYQAYSGVLCSLLDSYLEGYLVACRAIGSLSPEEPVGTDEAVGLCFEEGERMLKDGSIRREESLSRIALKNSLKCYRKMGLIDEVSRTGDDGKEKVGLIVGERFEERFEIADRIMGFLSHTGGSSG